MGGHNSGREVTVTRSLSLRLARLRLTQHVTAKRTRARVPTSGLTRGPEGLSVRVPYGGRHRPRKPARDGCF